MTETDERLRAITLLQQKANSLEAEIAERKVAEEALRLSEMRYRRLFEAARDGVLILDPETQKILDANAFMEDLPGYSRTEIIGKELFEIGMLKDRFASQAMFQVATIPPSRPRPPVREFSSYSYDLPHFLVW